MKLLHGEKLIGTIIYKGVELAIIDKDAAIYAGTRGFAANNTDEPDIGGLLKRYETLASVEKRGVVDSDWCYAVSIGYWRNGEVPRGFMFAVQVTDRSQDAAVDVWDMPSTMYIRVKCDAAASDAIFGRPDAETYKYFGIIKDLLARNGFSVNDNGAEEFELYHEPTGDMYANVQVKKQIKL